MANYIVLGKFTDQGIKGIKQTTQRAKAFEAAAAAHGCKVHSFNWCMGGYDLVLFLEGPNDETVAALGLATGSLGNVATTTMRAFSPSEMDAIISKMG